MCTVTCSPSASVQVAPASIPGSLSPVTLNAHPGLAPRSCAVSTGREHPFCSILAHPEVVPGLEHWDLPHRSSSAPASACDVVFPGSVSPRCSCDVLDVPLVCLLGTSHLLTQAKLQQSKDTSPGRSTASAPCPLPPHSSVSPAPLSVSWCHGCAHNVPGGSQCTGHGCCSHCCGSGQGEGSDKGQWG